MYVHIIGAGVLFDHKKVNDNELKKMVKNKLLKKSKNTYYTNSDQLGELLMEIMLQEVNEFCKIDIQQKWAAHAHQQVITLKQITIIKYIIFVASLPCIFKYVDFECFGCCFAMLMLLLTSNCKR